MQFFTPNTQVNSVIMICNTKLKFIAPNFEFDDNNHGISEGVFAKGGSDISFVASY